MRRGLVTKRQLAGLSWLRLFRDVYVHRDLAVTHRTLCQAVALILPAGTAISGASAAYLHGADALDADGQVEVTVPRKLRMTAYESVTVRYSELAPGDVVGLDGVQLTSPPRTAYDLARTRPLHEAVVGVDAMVHACGLPIDAIARYAKPRAHWHGAGSLGEVLALATAGAESPMETRLRLVLIASGLPAPTLQHRVRDGTGRVVARLDMAYVDAQLGIDYDGGCHWDPAAVRRDLRRQNALHALGWTLLRFTAADVLHNPRRLIDQVRGICRTAATYERPA